MTNVIITLKVMPESPEVDFAKITEQALEKINAYTGGSETKTEEEPLAFGLKALKLMFIVEEEKGTTDDLEAQLREIEGVGSVEVTDCRRAIG